MTIQLAEYIKHSAQNNPNIISIMAEMIATMENDAKLKKEILLQLMKSVWRFPEKINSVMT